MWKLYYKIRRKLAAGDSNLVRHAKTELALLSTEDDEYQNAMNKHLIKMVKMFSGEGHSGFSAQYAIGMLSKLLRYQPLLPLTGADNEWHEIERGVFQNIRCSHVFKDNSGAYDIFGKVFVDDDGVTTTNSNSCVYIQFPYTPTKEYVKTEPKVDGV